MIENFFSDNQKRNLRFIMTGLRKDRLISVGTINANLFCWTSLDQVARHYCRLRSLRSTLVGLSAGIPAGDRQSRNKKPDLRQLQPEYPGTWCCALAWPRLWSGHWPGSGYVPHDNADSKRKHICVHILIISLLFNDLSEGCALRIKIGLSFQ